MVASASLAEIAIFIAQWLQDGDRGLRTRVAEDRALSLRPTTVFSGRGPRPPKPRGRGSCPLTVTTEAVAVASDSPYAGPEDDGYLVH